MWQKQIKRLRLKCYRRNVPLLPLVYLIQNKNVIHIHLIVASLSLPSFHAGAANSAASSFRLLWQQSYSLLLPTSAHTLSSSPTMLIE
jgi:hypothetical protein